MCEEPLLVYYCISQQWIDMYQEEKKPYYVQVYPKDIKVKIPHPQPSTVGGSRQNVFHFSDSSRRRLLHVCRNSGHHIKSQFCLTYHEAWPLDGKEVKANLNHFLTCFKRAFGNDSKYLWVLEFQKRGAPHIHFFSDLEPCRERQRTLTDIWVVTVLGLDADSSAYKFHNHSSNFFSWNMRSGKYLSKEYLEKSVQKGVPENFQNVGRFWGHSRNMKPGFLIINPDDLPGLKQEIKSAVRTVTKAHEKLSCRIARACRDAYRERCRIVSKRKPIKKRNLRAKIKSYTVPLLSGAFMTILNSYLF